MILVFLNNKLVTADTIVPFMLEVKKSFPLRKIVFYCADQKTYDILRINIVISEAIAGIGDLSNLGSPSRSWRGRLIGIWAKLYLFSRVIFCLATNKIIHFVHFRALNEFPFSLLAKLNWSRTIFMESTCWGYSKLMIEDVGNRHGTRRWTSEPPNGGLVIGFSRQWPQFSHPDLSRRRCVLLPSTHLAPAWLDFVAKSADRHLKSLLIAEGWASDSKIGVFILGTFGKLDFLRSPETMKRLLSDTLDALQKYSSEFPIILKPHAITDRGALDEALAGRSRCGFIVSDIHPMVLGLQARFFVANYVSLTFGDAKALGVPTIEYTDYSDEVLNITNGGSMRPDLVTEFVTGSSKHFRSVLEKLSNIGGDIASIPRSAKSLRGAVELFCG